MKLVDEHFQNLFSNELMAKANPFDPSDVSHVTNYTVKTTGDRFFIPFNDEASTADQLAQCETLSPVGVESVSGS